MAAADAIFPADFVWGAATAAYQIEGAYNEAGRGRSIWDTFSHFPGNVVNGDTGDIACDHYHRYHEDTALMRELGLGGYRLSISWPRIFPTGRGRANDAGLDFYKRLIESVQEAGSEPFVTLYHWDLPQTLQYAGGWANRDTAKRFGEFAHEMGVALGGDVHRWITINEPWVAAFLGHLEGVHAPGLRDLRTALAASHHLLLAHAEALAALRAESRDGDQVGITLVLAPCVPAGDSQADLEAAVRQDGYLNRWFLDPVFKGSYPDDMLHHYGDLVPEIERDDLSQISAPIDFLGVNYYFRMVTRYDPTSQPVQAALASPPENPVTAMGWEIYPDGLYDVLTRVHQDYAPAAIYITENGAAYPDRVIDRAVDDPEREAYLHDHLLACYRAIEEGVPLCGYFAWSLMDNFEWSFGYSRRFGLIHVDYATQERTIKRSGHWYANVTRENGIRG